MWTKYFIKLGVMLSVVAAICFSLIVIAGSGFGQDQKHYAFYTLIATCFLVYALINVERFGLRIGFKKALTGGIFVALFMTILFLMSRYSSV